MEMTMKQQNSSFSWARLQMVAAYYYPLIKKQMIWYPIVVVILYTLGYLCQLVDWLAPIGVTFIAPFSFMFYWAPIVIARRDSRMITSMLPATAAEKIVFLALYFFVAIPVLIYGVELALIGLTQWLTPQYEFILSPVEVVRKTIGDVFVLGQLDDLIPTALCFWSVIYFKENRTFKSLLVSGGALVAIGVAGAVYAAIFAVKMVLESAASGAELSGDAFADSLMSNIAANMEPFMIGIGVFSILFTIFMVWLSYRRIKTYQC